MASLVLFTAPGCAYCGPVKRSAQALEADGKIEELVVRDLAEERPLFIEWQVQSVPTILVMDQGQVRGRHSGVLSTSQLEDFIERSLQSDLFPEPSGGE